MGDVVRMPLRQPDPERMREMFAAADEAWPEYEAALKAQEREMSKAPGQLPDAPKLRLVR